jgi:hypothetical protein
MTGVGNDEWMTITCSRILRDNYVHRDAGYSSSTCSSLSGFVNLSRHLMTTPGTDKLK